MGTRVQEAYRFEKIDGFRHIISMRYKLLPYLYSEYMKAVLRDEMMFRPLAFDYPEDRRAVKVEDQLLLGDGMMIAPVYEQNAEGRYVYLPERMKLVPFQRRWNKRRRDPGEGRSLCRSSSDRCHLLHPPGSPDPDGKRWSVRGRSRL